MLEILFTYATLVGLLVTLMKKILKLHENEYKIHNIMPSKTAKNILSLFIILFNISILMSYISTRFTVYCDREWEPIIRLIIQISIMGIAISFQCWPDLIDTIKEFKIKSWKIKWEGIKYCPKGFIINGKYFDKYGRIII